MQQNSDADREIRRRQLLVALLTANSGATDAIGFLALGGAFTSVMTGNMVLFGLATARADGDLVRHTAAAIAAYVAGCLVGARVAGTPTGGQDVWPPSVTRGLLVEVPLVGTYAVGWWLTGTWPNGPAQLALLAVTAIALGVQSSAIQRFGVSGLSTTYMTGTLTTVMVHLVHGRGLRAVAPSAQLLASLVVGAAVGALLLEHARFAAPLVQLLFLVIVLVWAGVASRNRDGSLNGPITSTADR